jgi:hypothetical protein
LLLEEKARPISLSLRETEINPSFHVSINAPSSEIGLVGSILSDFRVKPAGTSSLVRINASTLDIELIATILDVF